MWKIRLYKFFMTICFSFPEFSSSRNISVKILPIQQIISKTFLFNYPFLYFLSFFCNRFFSILSALHYPIVDLKNSGKILKMYEVHGTELHVEQPIIFLSAVRRLEWQTDRQTDTLKKFWTCQYKKIETKFGLTTDKLHFGAFNELYKRWRTQNDIGCYTKFCSPIWNVWPKVYMKNR